MMTRETARDAAAYTVAHDGGTFDADTLAPLTLTDGYVVGAVPGTWRSMPAPRDARGYARRLRAYRLADAIAECRALADRIATADRRSYGRRYAVGTWCDDGTVHVDPVVIIDSLADALRIGAENGQRAVWSAAEGIAIDLDRYDARLGILS